MERLYSYNPEPAKGVFWINNVRAIRQLIAQSLLSSMAVCCSGSALVSNQCSYSALSLINAGMGYHLSMLPATLVNSAWPSLCGWAQ